MGRLEICSSRMREHWCTDMENMSPEKFMRRKIHKYKNNKTMRELDTYLKIP